MNTNKTYVLAVAIAAAMIGTPIAVFAKNVEDGTHTAISMGQYEKDFNLFGDELEPIVVEDYRKGLRDLVEFVSPVQKTFVVRSSTVYNHIRQEAIRTGVTSNERVANTQVFAVEDALAAVGLHISAEQYALARGLKVSNDEDRGILPNEAELLVAVYNDLIRRLNDGELQFKIGGNSHPMVG